jgi:hypothetical protein
VEGAVKQILSAFSPRDSEGDTSGQVETLDASSGSDLESRIDYQALLLHTAPTPAERRSAWFELTRLHAMRSPQRIAEMEGEAGLAR